MAYQATLIPGDGIGPEITAETLKVLEATGVACAWDTQLAGVTAVEQSGTPIPEATLESIRQRKLALKGPLTTPVGTGFRSVNVALRKAFELYANLRPAYTILPGRYDNVDVVLVRENLEGLYSGVEHFIQIGSDPRAVAVSEAILTRHGAERIVRFAFDYAVANDRKKVTLVQAKKVVESVSFSSVQGGKILVKVGMKAPLAALPQSFAVTNPATRVMMVLGVATSLLLIPSFSALMPVFAVRVFATGPEGLGLLLSAFGAGGVLGGLVAVWVTRFDRIGLTQTLALLGFALSLIGFALSPNIAVPSVFLMGAGMAEMINMASHHTALQMCAPPEMRGRIASLLPMFPALMAVGSLTSGIGADLIGASETVILTALITVGVVCFAWVRSRALRGLRLSRLMAER